MFVSFVMLQCTALESQLRTDPALLKGVWEGMMQFGKVRSRLKQWSLLPSSRPAGFCHRAVCACLVLIARFGRVGCLLFGLSGVQDLREAGQVRARRELRGREIHAVPRRVQGRAVRRGDRVRRVQGRRVLGRLLPLQLVRGIHFLSASGSPAAFGCQLSSCSAV